MTRKIQSKGYKPHVAAELLEVGTQTLRYWRAHVDPRPYRKTFPSGILLAYQVIKIFSRRKHVPVTVLEQCSWERIFALCESRAPEKLANLAILIDEKKHDIKVVDVEYQPNIYDLDLHLLPLRPVVDGHFHALHTFGHDLTESFE